MKFSEIVKLRERLREAYSTDAINNHITNLTNEIAAIKSTTPGSVFTDGVQTIVDDLRRTTQNISHNNDVYNALMHHLDQQIAFEGNRFFGDNYKLEIKYNVVEKIRTIRVLPLSDEIHEEIVTRIRLYTSWQFPALEIGCRDGEWTKYMVGADPLYIVDHYREFTDSAVKDFTDEYKRRIRVYLTPDHDLSILPKNQFSFALCWNFLNYRSLDTIKEYLKQIKELLRPGGVFLFSYNDGDRPAGAGYAENFFMSYMPKSMLVPLCESLGFEVISDQAREMAISWLEIRKPGELKTVKAHQTMGELKRYGH
jgi:SAM-dependent methyltransferase